MVGLDGYLQRPNTCPDRAVPPNDEELSHTHTLVGVKNTTRIVPTVVTSRVHCAMGKNFSFSSRLRSIYYLWFDRLKNLTFTHTRTHPDFIGLCSAYIFILKCLLSVCVLSIELFAHVNAGP